jgi:hypothetical protein
MSDQAAARSSSTVAARSAARPIGDNLATSVSTGGTADTNGGLAVFNFNGDPKLVTVQNSVISGNITKSISTTGPAMIEGGASPVTLTNTQIALNRPDQCVGCQGMQAAAAGNRAHDDRGHRNLSTLLRQLDK